MKSTKLLVLFGVVALSFATVVRADTIKVSLASRIQTSPGIWTFTYNVNLTNNSAVVAPGDFFAVADFYNYVPGSLVQTGLAAGFAPAIFPMQSPTFLVNLAAVPDLPGVANIEFTYQSGPTLTNTVSDPLYLGWFSAASTSANWHMGRYLSQDHKNIGPPYIRQQGNFGLVETPDFAGPGIPLPASLWSGLVLGAAVCLNSLRRRSV